MSLIMQKRLVTSIKHVGIMEFQKPFILKDQEITRAIKKKSMRNYFNYKKILSEKIDYSLFDKVEQLIIGKFKQLIGDYFQTCNIVE